MRQRFALQLGAPLTRLLTIDCPLKCHHRIDGERHVDEKESKVGLEAYGRGDKLQLLLDTDKQTLRFGLNGTCMPLRLDIDHDTFS